MNQQPYIVGQYYSVPVVEIKPDSHFYGLHCVPVIGPQHNDKAILKFDYDHYHVDWRFVDKQAWERITEYGDSGTVFGQVLHADDWISGITMRRRLCKREFGQYPTSVPKWMPALETAYETHTLGTKRICPHKGADLSSIAPDANGLLTCPLHGLTWNTKTGCIHRNRTDQ